MQGPALDSLLLRQLPITLHLHQLQAIAVPMPAAAAGKLPRRRSGGREPVQPVQQPHHRRLLRPRRHSGCRALLPPAAAAPLCHSQPHLTDAAGGSGSARQSVLRGPARWHGRGGPPGSQIGLYSARRERLGRKPHQLSGGALGTLAQYGLRRLLLLGRLLALLDAGKRRSRHAIAHQHRLLQDAAARRGHHGASLRKLYRLPAGAACSALRGRPRGTGAPNGQVCQLNLLRRQDDSPRPNGLQSVVLSRLDAHCRGPGHSFWPLCHKRA